MRPADEGGAVVAFEKLIVVEAEKRNAVAALDTFGLEAGRQSFAALAELGVCIPVAPRLCLPSSVKIHAPVEATDRSERDFMASSLQIYRASFEQPCTRPGGPRCHSPDP